MMSKRTAAAAAILVVTVFASSNIGQERSKTADAPVTAENAPAVIKELSHRWQVFEDGRSERTDSVRVYVREQAALQSLSHLYIGYVDGRESVELRSLVVEKPDGTKMTLDSASLKDLPTPESGAFDAPTFSDSRIKQVTVPALAVGDTLAYTVVVSQAVPTVPGHFWTEYNFVKMAIVEREIIELEWPSKLALKIAVKPDKTVVEEHPPADPGRQCRRWVHQQLSVGKAETDALKRLIERIGRGRGDLPDIQVSSFHSWNEVAGWYAPLTAHAEEPTPALKERARALTASLPSATEKIAALQKLVTQDVRYVALAFGDGRYQARAADLVLSRQYGDCKDKHALLATLAREVGIDVRPVLINSRRPLDASLPSPGQFDHVISRVAVPGSADVWIDGTVGVARPGALVKSLRDKEGLLVAADGNGSIVRTPAQLAESQRVSIAVAGFIAADGKWRVKMRREFSGDSEMFIRQAFGQADQQSRQKVAEQEASESGFTGDYKAKSMTGGDPHDLKTPFWTEFEVEATYTSPLREQGWTFWPTLPKLDLPELDEDATEPLELGDPVDITLRAEFEVPESMVARPPVPVAIDNPLWSYRSSYEVKPGKLAITRHIVINTETIAADKFVAYRALVKAVNGDRQQTFAIEAAKSAPKVTDEAMTVDELVAAAGRAYTDRNYPRAVALYRRAVEKSPAHETAWNDLGRALAATEKFDEAIAAYEKQIAQNPFNEYAYNNRGLALWRQKKLDVAEQSFRKQIEVSPLDKFAYANLGLLQFERHHIDDAIGSLERAVALAPDNRQALEGLGRAYLGAKRQSDAVTTFKRWLDDKSTPIEWNNAAWWLADAGVELDLALEYAQKAVREIGVRLGRTSLAGITMGDAFAVGSLSASWDTLGWVHYKRGNLAEADVYLRQAWDLAQTSAVGEHLAQVYEAKGRRDDAISVYRLSLAASTGDTTADVALGRLKALGGVVDESAIKAKESGTLASLRTLQLPSLSSERASAEFLILMDGAGSIVDARFLKGDHALESHASQLVGVTSAFKTQEGATLRVVRRASVSCGADKKCVGVLQLPRDVRSIE